MTFQIPDWPDAPHTFVGWAIADAKRDLFAHHLYPWPHGPHFTTHLESASFIREHRNLNPTATEFQEAMRKQAAWVRDHEPPYSLSPFLLERDWFVVAVGFATIVEPPVWVIREDQYAPIPIPKIGDSDSDEDSKIANDRGTRAAVAGRDGRFAWATPSPDPNSPHWCVAPYADVAGVRLTRDEAEVVADFLHERICAELERR